MNLNENRCNINNNLLNEFMRDCNATIQALKNKLILVFFFKFSASFFFFNISRSRTAQIEVLRANWHALDFWPFVHNSATVEVLILKL